MEKRSVPLKAGRKNSKPVLSIAQKHLGTIIVKRLFVLLSALSAESKKICFLRPLRLCGEKI